jgi:hypothetical protein
MLVGLSCGRPNLQLHSGLKGQTNGVSLIKEKDTIQQADLHRKAELRSSLEFSFPDSACRFQRLWGSLYILELHSAEAQDSVHRHKGPGESQYWTVVSIYLQHSNTALVTKPQMSHHEHLHDYSKVVCPMRCHSHLYHSNTYLARFV